MVFKRKRQKFISLKEAAKLSGYTPDYIGYLIRQGKIPGEKIHPETVWVTTEEAIKEYEAKRVKEKENKEIVREVFNVKNYKRKKRKLLAFSWQVGLAAFLIVCLITGFAPIRFLLESIRALPQETKTVNFYSQNCLGDWQNSENVQGEPEIGAKGDIKSFSASNSAVYKNGSSYLVCQDFVREVQQVIEPVVEPGENELLQPLPIEEGTTTEEMVVENEEVLPTAEATTTITAETTTTEVMSQLQEGTSSQLEEVPSTGTEILVSEGSLVPPFEEAEEPSESPEPLIQGEVERFKSAKIKISFAAGEKEPNVSPAEQTTSTQTQSTSSGSINEATSSESSQEPISFWDKIKNFFGGSTAKAEEDEEENIEESTEEELLETEPLINETSTTETVILETTSTEETLLGTTTSVETTTTDSVVEATTTDSIEATTTDEIIDEQQQEEASSTEDTSTTTEIMPDLDTRVIVWYSLDGEIWWKLGSIFGYPLSNLLNDGYFEYEAPFLKNWEDVNNLKIKFEGAVEEETNITTFLDSIWVEVAYDEQGKVNNQEKPEISSLSSKKVFKIDEKPEFQFRYKKNNRNVLASIMGALDTVGNWEGVDVTVEVRDYQGSRAMAGTELVLEDNGDFFVYLHKSSRQFRPGKYRLKVKIEDNSSGSPQVIEFEEDFIWGVLAINTNKSIYLADEWAYLQMAALKDDGHTICDANLALVITTPRGETVDLEVQKSGECEPDNVTDIPDYYSYYQVKEIGTYQMKLINFDNGYEIFDFFEVRNSVPFDIERFGPTRIYPLADYEMTIRIKANYDLKGEAREYVPDSFIINRQSNPDIQISNDGGMIAWQVDWKAGETYELNYQFDAPDISPYLYSLGPLELFRASSFEFQEVRKWQIASDAPDLVTLRPNANGYSVQWTASTTNASDTSDQSDATYVYVVGAAAVGLVEFYHLEDPTFDQNATITSVTGYFRCRVLGGGAGPEKLDLFLRPTTTNQQIGNNIEVNDDVFENVTSTTQTTNPETSAAWTYSDITWLQIGMIVDALAGTEEIQCSEVYAVIDYTEPSANQAPTVSNVKLNGGSNIRLIEGSATTVVATATVSDSNTFLDLSSIIGRIYRSGVTSSEACTIDGNNCYDNTGCSTSSCSGNDCVASCTFNVWFIAEPTDIGSAWSGENWEAWIKAIDKQNASSSATNSSEMNTLTALDVTTSTNYGLLLPGDSNSPLDKLIKATTTGNEAIDADISGSNMCTSYPTCTVSTSIAYQHYATSSGLNYASTSYGVYIASSSAVSLEFITLKPTATPSNQAQDTYWGTFVPTGTAPGNYEGVNTFSASSDN